MIDIEQRGPRIMLAKINTNNFPTCIINTYNPQSGCEKTEKERHYSDLQKAYQENKRDHLCLILGDMNTRLQARKEQEEDVMGKFVFGKGEAVLETQAKDTSENRELFIEFCVENELVVTNTRFKKPNKEYCTYKEINTNGFCAPWTPERFSTIDMCLVRHRWRNIQYCQECRK